MKRLVVVAALLAVLAFAIATEKRGVEAFEISKNNLDLLPAGKEADGIIGDFVLRNSRIHALVSGSQPLRRANMSSEYEFATPGCLYDLDLRGANNDQITIFRPGDRGGELSLVRIVSDGADGVALVETVRTAAAGEGLSTRHEYRLQPSWQYLLITSTYRNESKEPKTITPLPVWKEFSKQWAVKEIQIGDSIDPADKRAYAWAPHLKKGETAVEKEIQLLPNTERKYTVALAVAESPLAAYGILASLQRQTSRVRGRITDREGTPAPHANILVNLEGTSLPAYPDSDGEFSFLLPVGDYKGTLADVGRDLGNESEKSFRVTHDRVTDLTAKVPKASAITFDIRDHSGQPSPCKVQFLGKDGTPTPRLGTDYRAQGCDHQYHSHNGQFTQQIPPGRYLLRITRGPEFDLLEKEVEVRLEQTVTVSGTLTRAVDSRGWISTDYHSHSTPSGDNYCSTDDRVINLAAENIEFAPTTEHNRLYDWQPHIERLGISKHLKTIIGIELTGDGQHFNSFPLKPTPYTQDGGAPVWQFDPRINAIVLRDAFGGGPDRWVQANHPIVGTVFNDRNEDLIGDGGFAGFERLIDAGEFWSTEILNPNPWYLTRQDPQERKVENRTFGWLQLLNQGRHVWCVAVSDAHRVFNDGVGGWRTYVPSSTDEPGDIDHREIVRNSKAGRMMITNGPFLQVATADGFPVGSRLVSPGFVELKVRVQTANWLEIDRVQILVNGRQSPQHNYKRATHPSMFKTGVLGFENRIHVALQEDAHIIVVATGESSDLSKGWGRSWESSMHPVAFTNPIYVDVDGNGFRPNGDTLGHPLLVTPRFD